MKIFILILISVVLLSCSNDIRLVNHSLPHQHIAVGAGPEDIQLVKYNDHPYLLVSCLERRKPNESGDIWLVDLQNYNRSVIARVEEPNGLRLRPHGIFVRENKHVYIIHHGLDKNGYVGEGLEGHAILYYLWNGKSLVFQEMFSNELLIDPNDLVVLPNGSFYATNSYSKNLFSFLLQDWNLKARSTVTYYDNVQKKWSIATSCLPYSNGIHYLKDKKKVLVSTTRGQNLWMYSQNKNGGLIHPELVVSNIALADNITQIDKDNIVLTSHQSAWNFYCHAKNEKYPSPTIVWKVNIPTKTATILYANEGGARINAGSTAILYDDKLYVAQVFESYLEVIDLKRIVK